MGLRVGPQFVERLRQQGAKLIVLVAVTTTVAFALAYGGSVALGLAPGFAPGLVRHGVGRDLAALLVDDLRRAVTYLQSHPTAGAPETRSAFHH